MSIKPQESIALQQLQRAAYIPYVVLFFLINITCICPSHSQDLRTLAEPQFGRKSHQSLFLAIFQEELSADIWRHEWTRKKHLWTRKKIPSWYHRQNVFHIEFLELEMVEITSFPEGKHPWLKRGKNHATASVRTVISDTNELATVSFALPVDVQLSKCIPWRMTPTSQMYQTYLIQHAIFRRSHK